MKGGSPFRLIQDYASDDGSGKDIEALIENLSPGTASPSGIAGETKKVSGELSDARGDKESGTSFSASEVTNKHVDDKNEDGKVVIPAGDPETNLKNDDLGSTGVDVISESDKFQKGNEEKNANSAPVPYKVDEFGRYLRQGASDSDSDDSRSRKRGRSRSRSRSQSRSPVGRRRSPWKRREKRRDKRSRSRSWSPRNRRRRSRSRSRSRTPPFRRASDFSSFNKRWERGHQSQACFDFSRGRCRWGASCRYQHNESDKGNRTRQIGSNQYSDAPAGSKNYNMPKLPVHDDDETERQEKEHCQDMQGSCLGAGSYGNFPQKKEDCSRDAVLSGPEGEGQSLNCSRRDSPNAGGVSAKVPEARIIQNEPEELNCKEAVQSNQPALVDSFPSQSVSDADALKSLDDTSSCVPALNSATKPPGTEPSSVIVSSSQANLSSTSVIQHHLHGQFSSQSSTYKGSSPPRSAAEVLHHPSQLHLPPYPPLSQSGNIPHMPQTSSMPLSYPPQLHLPPPPQLSQSGNVSHMAQTSFIPTHSVPRECFRPYIFPYQQPNFTVPPTSWNSLPVLPPPPPPPPLLPARPHQDAILNPGIAAPAVTLQSQQSNVPHRNDFEPETFVRSYPTQLPIHSQGKDLQHQAYPPMQEPYHALSHAEDFRLKALPAGNPPSHVQLPVQDSGVKNSFTRGSTQLQPTPDLREISVNQVQPFTGVNLPSSELTKSSAQAHPYSQQQQLHASADSFLDIPGKISSSRYPPNLPDGNQPSHLSDFGGSRIPTYYNPYASTFEQPLTSKLCSNDFRQESSCGLSHPSFDQQGLGCLQSRMTNSLPSSARTSGQSFPSAGKDQYDPLFDSIEPSSSSFKKSDHFQMRETTSDSNMLGFSGSNKPMDVEENNKKEVGTIAVTRSVDNDEFGETGDAEVGAVENGSPSDPIDSTDMNAGEVEIDQVKSSGKRKKGKDSRSMRVFKIALADFVKEVLKPSWRQGNMSKEAFKTIVKKTVEKVSGAMKNHQIPKSKAKIDHYIDSSQRKLTKLVMGYVDKYVKV